MKTHARQKPQTFEPTAPLEAAKQGKHFLVYYDGNPASLAALKTALAVAEADTEITAITFVAVPRSQPVHLILPHLETRAKAILAAAVANAGLRGIPIQTEMIQCHAVGPALVGRAAEGGATVIFLGVERADGEARLAPLAEYVLCFAKSQVVLIRL